MSYGYLKKSGTKKWQRNLAIAITAGLLAGGYAYDANAAEYNKGLVGRLEDNKVISGVVSGTESDLTYTFNGDNTVKVYNDTAFAIKGKKNVTINTGGVLTLGGTSGTANMDGVTGLSVGAGSNVVVNGKLNINSHGSNWRASGITVSGNSKEFSGNLVINGDVSIRDKSVAGEWGLTTENIHGGLGPGGSGNSTAPDYTGARWAPGGLTAGLYGNMEIKGNVDLAVKGSAVLTDPQYQAKGMSEYDSAVITLNGGNINIETPESNEETYYALANYGGTINVNVSKDGAVNDKDVTIKGNIITMKEDSHGSGGEFFYRDGRTNIALTTDKSSWTGVIDNTGSNQAGEVNLHIQNGADWVHQSMSKTNGMQVNNMPEPSNGHYGSYDGVSYVNKYVGGTSADKAGHIFQNDTADINIKDYSGHTTIVYKHENDGSKASDFKAGDVVIGKAAQGSAITVATDSKGIAMDNYNNISSVLNNLAGKLTYQAYVSGERNLNGKVQIASGLTTGSFVAAPSDVTGNIIFSSSDGKGSLDPDSIAKPVVKDFTTAITGNAEKDKEYAENGIIQEDGSYKFTEDSKITVKDTKNAIDGGNVSNLNIDAEGKELTIENISASGSNASGIYNMIGWGAKEDDNINITASKTNITVKNDSNAYGIYTAGSYNDTNNNKVNVNIKGDTNIQSEGKGYALGVYANFGGHVNIDGNLTMKAEDGGFGIKNTQNGGQTYDKAYFNTIGIYASGQKDSKQNVHKSSVTVTGDVDLAVDGTGILANQNGATVDIEGGGTIKVNDKPAKFNGTDKDEIHYAIAASLGTVNMNVQKDEAGNVTGAGDKTVKVYGNLGVDRTAFNENDSAKNTEINLGLNTSDSVLHGVVVNNITESDKVNGYTGGVNLYMGNGATWINEAYGTAISREDDGVGGTEVVDFNGSKVNNFVGGKDADSAAYIIQKDKNDLNIENYSGNAVIVYEHVNDGSKVEDYVVDSKDGSVQAGNVVIGKAAENSNVVLSTDSKGISVDSTASVEKTFEALAQKLTYTDAANNDNLKGSLQIASGLTSSSLSYKIGDLEFAKDDNGVAHYVSGSIKDGDIQFGRESEIMRGVRSAIASNALSWRDTAADLYKGRVALQDGETEGVWATAYGGQTEFDASNINLQGNYWAGKVGYDKALSNGWTVGASFDYLDGEADYTMGGQSENTLYGFGLYGSKALKDNAYFDFAVKVGHVKGDFSAKNELSREVKGDYSTTGYGISAQYGKRFGDVEKGYFEPQLQFTWARLGDSDFTAHESDGAALEVSQDAFDSFVGRVGIEAGQKTNHGHVYARLSLAHEFAGDADSHFFAPSETANGVKTVNTDLGGTWSELTVGGTYNISKCSNFYADITRTLTGDYEHEWKLNAGLEFNF